MSPGASPTPGQTVGPFFGFGLPFDGGAELVPKGSPGAVVLEGSLFDGAGMPVPDALIEIWQADGDGRIPNAPGSLYRDGVTFTGFGRAATDEYGRYRFWTREPGRTDRGTRVISVVVFARGLLDRLHTRIYLPEDSAALDADPVLRSLTPEERATLIAQRGDDGSLHHDIRLQGERETVFLDFG